MDILPDPILITLQNHTRTILALVIYEQQILRITEDNMLTKYLVVILLNN